MYTWMATESLVGATQIVVYLMTVVAAAFSLIVTHR